MSDKILGNIKGLKKSTLAELENLYSCQEGDSDFISEALLQKTAALTEETGREIAVYLNRRGRVEKVAVGDSGTVDLPVIDGRRAANRLSGITCLHTHPAGTSDLSELDIAALKKNRYDAMIAAGVSRGAITGLSIGLLAGLDRQGGYLHEIFGPFLPPMDFDVAGSVRYIESLIAGGGQDKSTAGGQEIAYLAGLDKDDDLPVEESLAELARLAETAGAQVAGAIYQKKPRPDPGFYLGSGRIRDMALACQEHAASLGIFDDELTPAQQRNIEKALGVKIIDRTELILDIFAQRANTHEGKMQVELAQLQYQLPRLTGQGLILSRLGGGIGTRGPGETKLETDRRHIRNRISEIEKNLLKVQQVRAIHRQNRATGRNRLVSLVGYTNAGKSTLLNSLTNASVYVEDQLFATLDPTTRSLSLLSGIEVMLTDTVGFIRKLPHKLVAAFRATLEEVVQADLLLHVIDASNPYQQEQSDAVYDVLQQLGVHDKKIITVFNKIDKITDDNLLARLLRLENSVAVSARHKKGLPELMRLLEESLAAANVEEEYLIPYEHSAAAARLHECAAVLSADYQSDGVLLRVSGVPENLREFVAYRR